MAKTAVALRLEPGLLARVDAYAQQRGVSRQRLLEAAVEGFMEDAERGVPDVEEPEPDVAATAKVDAALRKAAVDGVSARAFSDLAHSFGISGPAVQERKDALRIEAFHAEDDRWYMRVATASADPGLVERQSYSRDVDPDATREDFARATEERSELFSGLRTPDSIAVRSRPKS